MNAAESQRTVNTAGAAKGGKRIRHAFPADIQDGGRQTAGTLLNQTPTNFRCSRAGGNDRVGSVGVSPASFIPARNAARMSLPLEGGGSRLCHKSEGVGWLSFGRGCLVNRLDFGDRGMVVFCSPAFDDSTAEFLPSRLRRDTSLVREAWLAAPCGGIGKGGYHPPRMAFAFSLFTTHGIKPKTLQPRRARRKTRPSFCLPSCSSWSKGFPPSVVKNSQPRSARRKAKTPKRFLSVFLRAAVVFNPAPRSPRRSPVRS
jgi:hypothetical protein